MANKYDGITPNDIITEQALQRQNRHIYHESLIWNPADGKLYDRATLKAAPTNEVFDDSYDGITVGDSLTQEQIIRFNKDIYNRSLVWNPNDNKIYGLYELLSARNGQKYFSTYQVFGNTIYSKTYPNLVSNDMTTWTGSVGVINSTANGIIRFTATTQYQGASSPLFAITVGHRYYSSALMRRVTTVGNANLIIQQSGQTQTESVTGTASSTFTKQSFIFKPTIANGVVCKFQDRVTSGFAPIEGTKVVCIDITNIPNLTGKTDAESKIWCDTYLKYTAEGVVQTGDFIPSPDEKMELARTAEAEGKALVNTHSKNMFKKLDGVYAKNNITATSINGIITLNASTPQGYENTICLNDSTLTTYIPTTIETAKDFKMTKASGSYFLKLYFSNLPTIYNITLAIFTNLKQIVLGTTNNTSTLLNGMSITLSTGEYIKSVYMYSSATTIWQNCEIKSQLELGSIATPFEPFIGNTTIEIATPPLGKLPNGVRDTLDSTKLFRQSFKGSESWALASVTSDPSCISFYINVSGQSPLTGTLDTININCNMFEATSRNVAGTMLGESAGVNPTSGALWITIKRTRLTTINIAGFQTFLLDSHNAGTPVIVEYELATPIPKTTVRPLLPDYGEGTVVSSVNQVPASLVTYER